jgi:hypothetical protein
LLHFYKSKNWIFLLLLESIFWVLWIHKNKKTPLNFIFLNLQKMKIIIIIVIIFKKSIFGVVNFQGQKMHSLKKSSFFFGFALFAYSILIFWMLEPRLLIIRSYVARNWNWHNLKIKTIIKIETKFNIWKKDYQNQIEIKSLGKC